MSGSVTTAELEHWRTWIGRCEERRELLAPEPLRRFAAATGAALDVECAMPPLAHWAYFLPVVAADALGTDGHPRRGGFLPPIRYPRRMFAASSMQFLAALRLGQEATSTATVADVRLRSGNNGEMVLVEVERILEQAGTVCVQERQTLIYREGAAPTPAVAPVELVAGPEDERWTPGPVELFRFSAATFNSHRIHYDAVYASDEEGYPALVVHGPLTAARLCAYAQRRLVAPLVAFSFRAIAPQFVSQPVLFKRGEAEREFVVLRCDGARSMIATAAA